MLPSSQTALDTLRGYKPRDTDQTLKEAEQRYDVGGYNTRVSKLRGLTSNLESAIEAVDPSVTGRTSGTFTTEGQRQALVNRERTPILGDLAKQQRALGVEESGLQTAQNFAGNYASSLLSQDQAGYQRLLDQYNASTAYEQQQEQKRQFEAQLAFQREQEAARTREAAAARALQEREMAAAQTNYLAEAAKAFGGGQTSSARTPYIAKTGSPPAALQQLYNQVFIRPDGNKWSDQDLKNDYRATLASARYGNSRDKLKVELYHKTRPDLFGSNIPAAALGNGGQLSY